MPFVSTTTTAGRRVANRSTVDVFIVRACVTKPRAAQHVRDHLDQVPVPVRDEHEWPAPAREHRLLTAASLINTRALATGEAHCVKCARALGSRHELLSFKLGSTADGESRGVGTSPRQPLRACSQLAAGPDRVATDDRAASASQNTRCSSSGWSARFARSRTGVAPSGSDRMSSITVPSRSTWPERGWAFCWLASTARKNFTRRPAY
jgi:hypothetical protein